MKSGSSFVLRLLPGNLGLNAVIVASALWGGSAMAQLAGGGLSDSGLGSSSTSLRDTVSQFLSPPADVNLGRPFTFTGDIGVYVGATDSPGGIDGGFGGVQSGWQPFLLISPDFSLNGVSSRLTVALNYSPRLVYYPQSSSQTLFSNTFNGLATLTVLPDWLYVSVRGVTGLTSRFGGANVLSNSFYSTSDAVQTSSFSINPYLQHTFGTRGTLTAGYIFAASFQDADNLPYFAPNASRTAGYGTTGNLQTSTEYATYVTGESLGRIQNSTSVSASQNSGSAFYSGSSRLTATNQVSYSLYRWLTLLASVGYEEYDYPSSAYNLSDVTWTIGATVIPNADSSITVVYGRKAGSDTILANGTYSPTARTRIYGGYNVEVETGIGARQGLLGTTSVGPGGILVYTANGSPVLANSYLASQFTLSRVKTLSIGGALLLDRDTFSLSYGRSDVQQLVQSQDVLGFATPAGTRTTSDVATIAWQHEFNPSNSLSTSFSYGTSDAGVYFGVPNGNQDTYQFNTTYSHVFTDTLTGSASYSHSERTGSAVRNLPAVYGGAASQNTILVGLRKSF